MGLAPGELKQNKIEYKGRGKRRELRGKEKAPTKGKK